MKIRTRDRVGMLLSAGCIVHCIMAPMIIPVLPLLGLTVSGHEYIFHLVMAAIVSIVALLSTYYSKKNHHNSLPLTLAISGSVILFIGGILEALDKYFTLVLLITLLGSCLIIAAHWKNHKLLCHCNHHK